MHGNTKLFRNEVYAITVYMTMLKPFAEGHIQFPDAEFL